MSLEGRNPYFLCNPKLTSNHSKRKAQKYKIVMPVMAKSTGLLVMTDKKSFGPVKILFGPVTFIMGFNGRRTDFKLLV